MEKLWKIKYAFEECTLKLNILKNSLKSIMTSALSVMYILN